MNRSAAVTLTPYRLVAESNTICPFPTPETRKQNEAKLVVVVPLNKLLPEEVALSKTNGPFEQDPSKLAIGKHKVDVGTDISTVATHIYNPFLVFAGNANTLLTSVAFRLLYLDTTLTPKFVFNGTAVK